LRGRNLRALAAIAVVVSATAAGCGGGGGDNDGGNSSSMSKQEYADTLDTICNRANREIQELRITGSIRNFKDRGDEIVTITRRAINKFNAVDPPNEIRDAGKRFQKANQNLLGDIEQAVQAAKAGDESKFNDARQNAQQHGEQSNAAAREIGADDCA
jgi:hypothetical protein